MPSRTFCLFAFLTLSCELAFADLILDQSHVPNPNEQSFAIVQNADHAQTFTVGIAGKLARVDIEVERRESTTDPLLFDIRRIAGGVPTDPNSGSSVLAQVALDASQIPDDRFAFVSVDVAAFDISVNVADTLAIVLRTDSTNFLAYSWHGTRGNGTEYSRGARFQRTPGAPNWSVGTLVTDVGFRTFVTAVPEPSALVMFASSGLILFRRRSRKSI